MPPQGGINHLFRLIRWGLLYSVIAIIAPAIYAAAGGTMSRQTNWVGIAEVILVISLMVLGLSASIGRAPNPYTRTYRLYDLRDVPQEYQTLDSGSADLLWNLVPILIAIAILAKFVVLH